VRCHFDSRAAAKRALQSSVFLPRIERATGALWKK
jgi:hypothetical protein